MPAWLTSAVSRAQQGASAGAAIGALFEGFGAVPGALAGAAVAVGIGAVADWEDARSAAKVLAGLNANVPGPEVEAVVQPSAQK